MGEPWFKLAPRAKEWGLIALSSNYELYGDISARVMELLGRYSAWLEVYSIDEAFLGVKGTPAELLTLGRSMKAAVRRNVGVPVCVGIAATTGVDEYSRVAYCLLGRGPDGHLGWGGKPLRIFMQVGHLDLRWSEPAWNAINRKRSLIAYDH